MRWAKNGRWLDRTIIAGLLATGFLLPTSLVAKAPVADSPAAVAVLFAPWVDAGTALQRVGDAGARIVAQGALPFIVLAEPEHPDFADRASARGAMLILDPRKLAACFTVRRT